jgi:hypothetical protein
VVPFDFRNRYGVCPFRAFGVGRVPNPTDTYLMYAQIAVDMAADEADPGRRVALLQIAQSWRDLADKDAPRIAQQQQQPQPDNENEK